MDKIVISFFKYRNLSKFLYSVNIHTDLLIN